MKTLKGISVSRDKGKLRAKVQAGQVEIGDVLVNPAPAYPDYRVTGLGRPWEERGWIGGEEARSFGGAGQAIHQVAMVQYAYCEPVHA